ncbi:MAG TPA: helix-turn-helix domain-containing protein, partial [Ilumatobacteraceae bacterium]|nr:helix-turn-helix domain-containing protein [Ilumatobacteraceae bacterium]
MALEPSPGVIRAGSLLSLLAGAAAQGRQSMSASELARVSGVPRATCNSLLLGLLEAGLVRRNNDLSYALGIGCVTLGDAARAVNPLLSAAAEHAERLAEELGGIVAVTVRHGAQTRVAEVFDYGPPIGYRVRALESIPLVPPFGATFVAWDSTQIDAWLDRADPPLTDAAAAHSRRLLDAVRRRG